MGEGVVDMLVLASSVEAEVIPMSLVVLFVTLLVEFIEEAVVSIPAEVVVISTYFK